MISFVPRLRAKAPAKPAQASFTLRSAAAIACAMAAAFAMPAQSQPDRHSDAQGATAALDRLPTESDYRQLDWLESDPWQRFLARQGGDWRVEWNPATCTPKAIWGSGLVLDGWRENSLDGARQHANRVLLDHRELLGLGASGFREVIGSRMGQTWTFTYQQTFLGLDVIGGRADVRVHMKGRVPMFGSMAFPIPADFDVQPKIDGDVARVLAWQALGEPAIGAAQPGADKAPRLVIWGDVQAADVSPFHLAWEVAVSNIAADGSGPAGRYYVHAKTGAVLHYVNDKHECGLAGCGHAAAHAPIVPMVPVESTASTPPVQTTVTVMGWTRTGIDAFAPLVNVPQAGLVLNVPGIGAVTTNANGQFTIDIATSRTIAVGNLDGRHHNPITGASAPSGSFTVNPGVATTIQLLTPSATANAAAHTTAAYWVDRTNQYARSILGNSAQLNTASNMAVAVNTALTCNAFYFNNTINFYQAGGGCSNSAFSSVIAHEWGHCLDDQYGSITNATRANGISEGWADIIACYLLDTPDLGSGFVTAGVPLRTGNNTTQYLCTGCTLHKAGESWMGFAWKLRDRLATRYGNRTQAINVTNAIVVSTIAANALNQPDAVREVFIADDNDGNLLNGTPNYSDLVWACNQHSLPYPQTGTFTHTLWATSVPETSSPANVVPWTNESYAAGAETCNDCNTSSCQYSTNSTNGNTTPLRAVDFQAFTVPAGQRITGVRVEVSGRYDTNTTANVGFRAFAPAFGLNSNWRNSASFSSGTLCAPRLGSGGDITSLAANWTAAMVNDLQFEVRRQSGLNNNTLRIVSIRLIVTTSF